MSTFFIVLLCVIATVSGCVYKNERFNDGDTWVVRSTFVMKCKITKSGWSTTVIGCKTARGVVVKPGESMKEGDTTYQCVAAANGRVEIIRTYDVKPSKGCEGHEIGDTWVVNRNFMKECTDKGVKIKECLTDAGIAVALNSNLALSGIVYTCTLYTNGTVSINREAIPNKNHFQTDNLLQVPASPVETEKRETSTPAPKPVELKRAGNGIEEVTCTVGSKTYKSEETWISENKFTKKCTPEGAVIILNCLIDDQTTINVNSELKVGKKTYKCYRKEGRVFMEVLTE